MSEILNVAWLAKQSDSLFISHNAHLESETTIARHLLHRERLQEHLQFATDRACCESGADLWELTIRKKDGRMAHFIGGTLDACVLAAERHIGRHRPTMLAA